MKAKKVMAALLASSIAMGTFSAGSTVVLADEEPYNIIMEIVTLGESPSGLEDVEAAINAIVEPEIGVTVTLYPVNVSSLATETNLMVSSGEKLDLCFNFYTGVSDLVDKNMIIPLDDLYEQYGQDIEASQGIAVQGGYYGGQLYGIPCVELHGLSFGFLARTDILDELGFTVEKGKVYTTDDLTELFAKYKEAYGDGHYCVAGLTPTSDFFSSIHILDSLGGSTTSCSSGVLMNGGLDGNTTVENLYSSDAYAEYANLAYEWAQAGYISPDASTNMDSSQIQMATGNYLGAFGNCAGDGVTVFGTGCGYDVTPIPLVENYATTADFSQLTWSIPITCENPEKTFQFLNLLYQVRDLEEDVDTLLTLGIEGVSYQMLEKGEGSRGIITYADGVDQNSSPYNMGLGIYGDKLTQPKWAPLTLDYYDEVAAFNDSIGEENTSCTLGYIFDATPVATQKAAVEAVITQYVGLISSGSMNPEDSLPQFNQALEAAGIADVIAENQRQLDEWLEAKGK